MIVKVNQVLKTALDGRQGVGFGWLGNAFRAVLLLNVTSVFPRVKQLKKTAPQPFLLGLGFWFAQQGSIYVFIVLIFFYAARMNALDREFDVHED